MKNFILFGTAGYIAPKHLKAIYDTGNNLIASIDPHDSVGILDRWFPDCKFFTEFERFDRYLEKIRMEGVNIDYASVCSPNYLHDAHCRFSMRIGADVICEKPVVLNPWNIDSLINIEKEYEKKVYVVLQLRLNKKLIALRNKIQSCDDFYNVSIKYITPRGNWYHNSWKGDETKSGGLMTNIGVHLFDLVLWLFGKVRDIYVEKNKEDTAIGSLYFDRANVDWFLSTNREHLPNKRDVSYRSININGDEIAFDESFTNLHLDVYKNILSGNGFGLKDSYDSINLVNKLRKL